MFLYLLMLLSKIELKKRSRRWEKLVAVSEFADELEVSLHRNCIRRKLNRTRTRAEKIKNHSQNARHSQSLWKDMLDRH